MGNKVVAMQQNNAVSTNVRYSEGQIKTIKNTVAKGSTDDELKMFISIAEKYGLDPFIKEMWFIKRAKKIKDRNGNWDYPRTNAGEIDYTGAETIIMTSRDGYLKIAQRDQDFDGIISFVVREGDVFEIDAENYTVNHKFGMKRGKIIGAWAKVSHKHRKPVIVWADYEEYGSTNSTIWKQYPSAMIQKVAELLALKRQFGISGLTTREEMSTAYDEYEASQTIEVKHEVVKNNASSRPHMMEKEQKSTIWDIAKAKGMSLDQLKQYTMQNLDTPLSNLNYNQANELLNMISKYIPEELPTVEAEQVELTEEEQETMNEFAATDLTGTPFEEA